MSSWLLCTTCAEGALEVTGSGWQNGVLLTPWFSIPLGDFSENPFFIFIF